MSRAAIFRAVQGQRSADLRSVGTVSHESFVGECGLRKGRRRGVFGVSPGAGRRSLSPAHPFYRAADHGLFHRPVEAPVWSFTGFSLLLVASCYSVARRLEGRVAGLLAAAMVMTLPGLDGFSRIYTTDYPLAAFLAMALTAMFASDGFRKRGWSMAFGALVGLGLLTKQSFVIYFLPAAVVYTVGAFIEVRKTVDWKRAAINFGLAAALACGVALTWYAPRFGAIFLDRHEVNAFYRRVEPESFDALDYAAVLARSSAGWIVSAAAVFGALASRKDKRIWALIAAVAVPLFFFSLDPSDVYPAISFADAAYFSRSCGGGRGADARKTGARRGGRVGGDQRRRVGGARARSVARAAQ
ncbi:MAG: glycosyltransferase family 39 protein [Deltaproteobacteria bacterium]|nr:glycosyltransferase family 39 protein [Deltaproteobacteria bacterium]